MNKKSQRIVAGVLAVLVSVAMVGSALIGYFYGAGTPSDLGTNNSVNAEAQYQDLKLRIEAMAKQAEVDPENISLQTTLGNGYYDAGMASQAIAPEETQENFKKAVEAYQKVLEMNKDHNITVDMATAAFYSGDYDLAEKTFNEALALKPDSLTALFNYGIFLSQAKQDWAGALNQWQKALPLTQDSSEKETIEALISQAQSQLDSKQTTDGVSNPILKDSE